MKRLATLLGVLLLALTATATMATPVNINTGTAAEIAEALSGIGEKKAQAIVADREANGPFKSADELTRVKGIGMATIGKNREDILVK